MKCKGLPRGPCPHNASGKYVKLCQGDLMLCHQCEQARFNTNNADKQENADTDANNDSQGSDPEETDLKQRVDDGRRESVSSVTELERPIKEHLSFLLDYMLCD